MYYVKNKVYVITFILFKYIVIYLKFSTLLQVSLILKKHLLVINLYYQLKQRFTRAKKITWNINNLKNKI